MFSKLMYHRWLQNKATLACIQSMVHSPLLYGVMYIVYTYMYLCMYVPVPNNLPYIPQHNGISPFISLYWGNY